MPTLIGTGEEVMMTTARDIMHAGVTCIGENETLAKAARTQAPGRCSG